MTYYPIGPEDRQGFVLSAGSICFGGSLVVDEDLQMIVSAALDECLGLTWHKQFPIAVPGSVRDGSPLVVLNRWPEHHDVFWIGANGDVSSIWRDDNADDGRWHPQFPIAVPGSVRDGSPLVVLNRRPEHHDVFWIGANGDVSSTWRDDL
jgi:hypothetical protein